MCTIENSYAAKYMLIYVNCLTINFVNKEITKMIKTAAQRKKLGTYSNGIMTKKLDFLNSISYNF